MVRLPQNTTRVTHCLRRQRCLALTESNFDQQSTPRPESRNETFEAQKAIWMLKTHSIYARETHAKQVDSSAFLHVPTLAEPFRANIGRPFYKTVSRPPVDF